MAVCGCVTVCCLIVQTEHEKHLLQTKGTLVGMDSTHCTNKEGIQLYTLVILDDDGSVCPAGMFMPSSNAEKHVTAALHELHRLTDGKWIPRIALVDDSATGTKPVSSSRVDMACVLAC